MTRRPLWLCALGCGFAAAVWQMSFAQTPAPGAATTKQARPQGEALRIDNLPPELEALLKEWEQNSAKIKTLTGTHRRWEYNLVFQVEKRSEGKFFFESPDKGRFDIEPTKIAAGEKSRRLGPDKTPFELQPGTQERWISTGERILQIDDKAKTYEASQIPPEFRGTNIVRSPLPFLFGMKADEAKKRYQFKLHPSEDSEVALLVVTPRTNQDAFRVAQVALNKRIFMPSAVKLFDLSGSIETSYSFSDLTVNDSGFKKRIKEFFTGDPFNPTLVGYKQVQPPDAHRSGVQPVNGQQPPGQKPAVQQTGGTRIQIKSQTTTIKISPKQPATQTPPANRPASAPPKSASSGRQP